MSRKLHLWVAVTVAVAAVAEVVATPALYEVEVDVPDQSQPVRHAASREGLETVLIRLTGLASLPDSAAVLEARGRPELYYDRFLFVADRRLKFTFSPGAVLDLIDRAQLPIWPAKRPNAIAWLAVEQSGRREIVQDGHPLAAALVAQAKRRGLEVYLPLMDLRDQMQVQPSDVWAGATLLLAAASRRYGAEAVLIGRLRSQQQEGYAGRVVTWTGGGDFQGEVTAADLAGAGAAAVDFLADGLASRHALPWRAPQWLPLVVDGVASPLHYGRLLRYLEGFEFMRSVRIAALHRKRLEVALQTRAEMHPLIELLTMDGRMASPPGAATNRLAWQGADDDLPRLDGRNAGGRPEAP